jgi:hypothetical protein
VTTTPGGPSRIDQIIPSIVEHDAVSNHTFAAQRLLRELGFVSEIYTGTIGPGTGASARGTSQARRRQPVGALSVFDRKSGGGGVCRAPWTKAA